jgi:hypothetical protein
VPTQATELALHLLLSLAHRLPKIRFSTALRLAHQTLGLALCPLDLLAKSPIEVGHANHATAGIGRIRVRRRRARGSQGTSHGPPPRSRSSSVSADRCGLSLGDLSQSSARMSQAAAKCLVAPFQFGRVLSQFSGTRSH